MKTKNLPLIVGIALPILFIVIISVIIFVPQMYIQPKYDFIYVDENPPYTDMPESSTYQVVDQYVVEQSASSTSASTSDMIKKKNPYGSTLYLYDVKTNTSRVLTYEQARSYKLNPNPTSPDGYIVKYEYGNDGVMDIFGNGSRDTSGYYVENDSGMKKLTGLVYNNMYYYRAYFRFLGWVKQ
jgi:hypothetical protein